MTTGAGAVYVWSSTGLEEGMHVARTLVAAALLLPLLACDGSPSAPSPSVPDVFGKYAGTVKRDEQPDTFGAWPALEIDVRQAASQVEITGELISVTGFSRASLPRIVGRVDKAGRFTPQPLAGAASTVDLGFCGSDTATTSLTVQFSSRAAEWMEWAATGDCGDQRYSGTLMREP